MQVAQLVYIPGQGKKMSTTSKKHLQVIQNILGQTSGPKKNREEIVK